MNEDKQIEEMAKDMCDCCRKAVTNNTCDETLCCGVLQHTEALYNAGYRKQSEGEWVHGENGIAHCSECGNEEPEHAITPYCSICGARMEGGAE